MRKNLYVLFATFVLASLILTACGGTATEAPAPAEPAAASAESGGESMMYSGELLGAGASFPAPIYLEWIAEYTSNIQPDMSINYQSIGSGGGVEQFIGQAYLSRP